VRLDCISDFFRRLLSLCGISMFGLGNVDVSFEISEPLFCATRGATRLVELRLYATFA
jgi:hypothetical protein